MDVYPLRDKVRQKYPAMIEDFVIMDAIRNPREELFRYEQYKLLPKDEILNYLNENRDCKEGFGDCERHIRYKELASLEGAIKNANFFVKYVDDLTKTVTLVTDYFIDYDRNIEIRIPFNTKVEFITPYNYECLKNSKDAMISKFDGYFLYKRLVYEALEKKASDIHITNYITKYDCFEYKIGYRLLNDFVVESDFEINEDLNKRIMSAIINHTTANIADLDSSAGIKTSMLNPLHDASCDLRITGNKTIGGYTCVTRIMKLNELTRTIESLGFDESVNENLRELERVENGLVLITGAIRTGKNTTMIAILKWIFENKKLKIKEYSSPIENMFPCEQLDYQGDREALEDMISLAKKEDVDLAVINELPDKSVAPAVYDLVNSSVGVFTTFHIERIWNFPLKMKNYFGEEYVDLITLTKGVINQKMFVKLCPKCRKKAMHRNFPKRVLNLMDRFQIKSFYEPSEAGCPECNFTGRRNALQPLAECLIMTDEIIDSLTACNTVWEMQKFIKDYMNENKLSLEYSVAREIFNGNLTVMDFEKLYK